ncbi:MAG: hypothetical protein V4601_09990 [Pseudomonadota bacterium]
MRQVGGAPPRPRQVLFAGFGELVDGAGEGLDFRRMLAHRQAFRGIKAQGAQRIAQMGERLEAKLHLHRRRARKHQPQGGEEQEQLVAELGAGGAHRRLVLGKLDQHVMPARDLQPPFQQQQFGLERSRHGAVVPVMLVADLVRGLSMGGGQFLVPERARTHAAMRAGNLPIESAGGSGEARIGRLGRDRQAALGIDLQSGDQRHRLAVQFLDLAPFQVALEQHRHHRPGGGQRNQDGDGGARQQAKAQRADIHAPVSSR